MKTQIAQASGFTGNESLELAVELDDSGPDCLINIKAKLGQEVANLTFVIAFHPLGTQVSAQAIPVSGTLAGCLAGCGYASIKPVIDCAKKSKTVADFKKCVTGKGGQIAGVVLDCLVACLALHATVP
jgi:hypothetical protein